MLLQMAIFDFLWLNNIPYTHTHTHTHIYVYIYVYIYTTSSTVNGYLGCFSVLIIVNSAARNIEVHVPC